MDDDCDWQNTLGKAIRGDYSRGVMLEIMAGLEAPVAALVCTAPVDVIVERNAERHARRPQKPDWGPFAATGLELTALARQHLTDRGAPVMDVDTLDCDDAAVMRFYRKHI